MPSFISFFLCRSQLVRCRIDRHRACRNFWKSASLPWPREPAINGALHGVSAGSVCEVLAGLGRGLSLFVVPYDGGHRSAPRVVAALAGFVHDRQSAADYEYNHDNNNE